MDTKVKPMSQHVSKDQYILRSLSKIRRKIWEHYVVNRVWHLIGDLDLEIVCQQCIRRPDNRIALADLFFPQLSLYLEVDEDHHRIPQNILADARRRHDILEGTGIDEYRIDAGSGITLAAIHEAVDDFVSLVRERREEREACGEWFPWDYEGRFRPETFMREEEIRIGPHSGFTRHDEAMRLFGYAGGTFQRGAWIMSEEISKQLGLRAPSMVWFPGLDEGGNPHWTNKFSLDGQRVTEASERDNPGYIASDGDRVIFAKSRDDLNRTLYRFIGVFEAIPEENTKEARTFRLKSPICRTLPLSELRRPELKPRKRKAGKIAPPAEFNS